MNPVIRFLLGTYKLAVQSGLMQTRAGRTLFLAAYRVYKRVEHRHIDGLRPLVTPGTWVLDVGANVGFLTRRFAGWVSAGGKLIAIEPETVNFEELQRVINHAGLNDKVELLRAVAAEQPGESELILDPYHPANHRIGSGGVPVQAVTLDALTVDRNVPRVSLVKVDTQGAELIVVKGARRLIERDHPALVVEVYDRALHEFGASARELIDYLTGCGYRIHQLGADGISAPITDEQALKLAAEATYEDFVFLYNA